MKKIVIFSVIAFLALTAGASAQSNDGLDAFWRSSKNTFLGNNKNTGTNNTNSKSGSTGINVGSQIDASIHYLNKPITLVSGLNIGLGNKPTTMGSGPTPTFFLLQNQEASIENFQFEIRGSAYSAIDIKWSVTGSNNNVQLQWAQAAISHNDGNGDRHKNTTGAGHTQHGSGWGFGHYGDPLDITEYTEGEPNGANSFSYTLTNVGFGPGEGHNASWGHDDDGTENGKGHSDRGGENGNGYGYGHEDAGASYMNVRVDFGVKAVYEPADDGFPGGAGDATDTGTIFNIKVEISNYHMLGPLSF